MFQIYTIFKNQGIKILLSLEYFVLLFCYRIRAKGLHELNQVQFYANDHLLYLK